MTAHRQALVQWLDERTGLASFWAKLANKEITGGARWAYVFGSSLLFIFTLQIFTGILLALYYVPSADHAHTSVAYLQKSVRFGSLLRGIHHYGSSAMIILIMLHLLQTFLWGAYKHRRELLWLVGVILLTLVLGFSFTGYLLPWDQKSYFGTKVAVSIMSGVPLVGDTMARIVLGGPSLSTLTLSRFFVTHTLVLPGLLSIFIIGHLILFWRARPAGTFTGSAVIERFYPRQFFKDSAFAFTIFLVLLALAYFQPAALEPEANPSDSTYIARPEWYFLPLYQLLKYFPGKLSLIPTVIVPAIAFSALALTPFIDRSTERNPWKRPVASGIMIFTVFSLVALIFISRYDDRRNPMIKAQLEQQTREAEAFLAAPFRPQTTGLDAASLGAVNRPPTLYLANCAVCHGETAQGSVGPSLRGIKKKRTRQEIINLIENPTAFGINPTMQPFPNLTVSERGEIADWLLTLE